MALGPVTVSIAPKSSRATIGATACTWVRRGGQSIARDLQDRRRYSLHGQALRRERSSASAAGEPRCRKEMTSAKLPR